MTQRHNERHTPARPSARPTATFFARRPTFPVPTARAVADALATLYALLVKLPLRPILRSFDRQADPTPPGTKCHRYA